MKHVNIKVFGNVQGVVFRFSAKEQADKLNITGFVQNQPNGTVYIEVEGGEKDLKEFIKWCKNGPEFASITKIEVSLSNIQNFSQFSIK